VAEQQKALAEAHLTDVRTLANSLLFGLEEQVRDLPGSTPARETLTRLGTQYLSKVSVEAAGDNHLQQQLGAAYLKMGDLQGQPGHSNIRDMDGARQSYARSVAILEPQVRANPGNPELRHLLTIATLRKAQLAESQEARDAGLTHARRMAEEQAARQPGNTQAQSDLAEALLAENDSECALCNRSREDVHRAIDIRQAILAKGPKTRSAQWELARAQTVLGIILVNDADPQALPWLESALTALNELAREEPANVQYKRDRAEALSAIAWSLPDSGRYEESRQRAREAVSIQEELASADPGNAAFRRDLSTYRAMLGQTLFMSGGASSEVMDSLAKAVAEATGLAVDQPRNPDLQRRMASFHLEFAGYLTYYTPERAAALAHLREAESIDRTLIRQHPGEKRYQRDLAALLPQLGDALADGKDASLALPAHQESVALWQRLSAESNAAFEDLRGLADARAALAGTYNSLGRKPEAITEDLAAVSLYERALGRNPKPIGTRRSLAETLSKLSLVYDSRSDFRAAVDASLKALPIVESDYTAHPGTEGATRALWRVLSALYNEDAHLGDFEGGLQAARRCVEIAEKYVAMEPEDHYHLILLRTSYNNLGVMYRFAARRQESLSAKLQAAAVFDRFPVGKLNALLQFEIAQAYLPEIFGLRVLEAQEDALPICRKAVSLLEPLVKGDPKNQLYRPSLVRAYRELALTARDLNDVPAYIENLEKMLKLSLETPTETAGFWRAQANAKLDIGLGQELAGQPVAAAQSKREAIEYFQRGRRLAQAPLSSAKQNLTALREIALADQGIAFVDERLGDLKAALEYRREAAAYAGQLSAADSGTAANRDLLADFDGAAARVQWLIDGSPNRVTPGLAQGWKLYSIECTNHNDAESGVAAANKAIEMESQLVGGSQAEARVRLASDLQQAGLAYLMMAHGSTGLNRQMALQKSLQSYSESRDQMAALKQASALPAAKVADLTAVAESIDNLKARLTALQAASRGER